MWCFQASIPGTFKCLPISCNLEWRLPAYTLASTGQQQGFSSSSFAQCNRVSCACAAFSSTHSINSAPSSSRPLLEQHSQLQHASHLAQHVSQPQQCSDSTADCQQSQYPPAQRSEEQRTQELSSAGGFADLQQSGNDTAPMQESQQLQQLQQLQHRRHAYRQRQSSSYSSTAVSAATDTRSSSSQAQQWQRRHMRGRKQRRKSSSNIRDNRNNGSRDEVASKLLTAAISSSSTWQQLHLLLQQDVGQMNHIHACALLTTASRLVQYSQLPQHEQQQFGDFYIAALQLAFARAQDLAGPREVSSMLWAVAKVGLHPGPEWLSAYLQAAAQHLDRMNPQDIGLLVWSLARFKHVPEPHWQQQLLAVTQQNMRSLDPQGLCNLIWGLATLDIQPDRAWIAAAVEAAGRHIDRFQAQGLAVVLWAVAKLGCRPSQHWLHAAAEAASRKLKRFKPAELSMLCHALARLHYKQPQQQTQPEQGLQQQQEQEQQPLLWQVQCVSQDSMHSLRFVEAANMLWALGALGQAPKPAWIAAALQRLAATMHEADGKALANAVYGLASMQHRPKPEWWNAVWQHLPLLLPVAHDNPTEAAAVAVDQSSRGGRVGHLEAADTKAQATLMLSVAKLGVAVPPVVAALLLSASQLQLQLHAMNAAEVVAVAMAAAKMRLRPPRSWLVAVESAFEALLLPSLQQEQQCAHQQEQLQQCHIKPKEVGNVLFSFARLRYVPNDRLLKAVQQYKQQYQQYMCEADEQQLSRALQSIADYGKYLQQLQQQQARVAALAADHQPGDDCNNADAAVAVQSSSTATSNSMYDNGSGSNNSSSSGNSHINTSSIRHTAVTTQELECGGGSSSGESKGRCNGNSSNRSVFEEHLQEVGKYMSHASGRDVAEVFDTGSIDNAAAAALRTRGDSRAKGLASVVHHAFVVAGGLSIAAS